MEARARRGQTIGVGRPPELRRAATTGRRCCAGRDRASRFRPGRRAAAHRRRRMRPPARRGASGRASPCAGRTSALRSIGERCRPALRSRPARRRASDAHRGATRAPTESPRGREGGVRATRRRARAGARVPPRTRARRTPVVTPMARRPWRAVRPRPQRPRARPLTPCGARRSDRSPPPATRGAPSRRDT